MKKLNISSNIRTDAFVANQLLKNTGVSLVDAARLIKNSLDSKPKRMKLTDIVFCSKVISLGLNYISAKSQSVQKGFEAYLNTKSQLRPASVHDIKYLARRIFKNCPSFARANFSEISISMCEKCLGDTFKTASQFNKAHRFLSGLFNYAIRQEWIEKNVVKLIEKKKVIEKEIRALTLSETRALLEASRLYKFRDCQAPLALLIWAGVRPQELRRITWHDIDLDENIITIKRNTSKTGGSRHIEICKALKCCLKKASLFASSKEASVVPPNWQNKWKALRAKAGFGSWTQDVLRHTYASYFTKHYKDLTRLQVNMGHMNLHLLRSRYVNLRDISQLDAKNYFERNF